MSETSTPMEISVQLWWIGWKFGQEYLTFLSGFRQLAPKDTVLNNLALSDVNLQDLISSADSVKSEERQDENGQIYYAYEIDGVRSKTFCPWISSPSSSAVSDALRSPTNVSSSLVRIRGSTKKEGEGGERRRRTREEWKREGEEEEDPEEGAAAAGFGRAGTGKKKMYGGLVLFNRISYL